ncbi:MAG TPA: glycosyltransferase family 4 protein, partial [Acidobacteriota bacterium]
SGMVRGFKTNSMRILFVTPGWSPEHDGIGDYTCHLSQELQKAGAQVSILTISPFSKVGHSIADESGLSLHVIGAGPRWDLPHLFLTLPAITRLKPDIVHLQYEGYGYNQSFLLPMFWSRLVGYKIATFHEMFFKTKLHKNRDRQLCRLSNHVIVNDEFCLDQYKKLNVNTDVSKVGVGSNIPVIPTESPNAGSGPIRIGYFGFFYRAKRVSALLKAFRDLLDQGNLNCELLLLGEFSPDEDDFDQSLLDLRNELGLQGKAHFTGALPALEVSKTLAACHMAVLPFTDGVSTRRGSFQACMALGIPTITTRSPVPDSEIRHNENAFLIDRPSRANIKQAMVHLAQDPALRSRLRQGALKFHENFTWEKIAREHLHIYDNVIHRHPPELVRKK